MERRQEELWARIRDFDIDGGPATDPFVARLAREQRWSREYAERVVAEYRRFVFLAMEAGHPATPSVAIDEAWHLHLCYTRSYWERMVGQILPRPLHHEPSRGGPAEDSRHRCQFAQTCASYERFFGHPPPADIWLGAPPTADPAAAPKRRLRPAGRWLAAGAAAGALAVAGCAPQLGQSLGGVPIWAVIGILVLGGGGLIWYFVSTLGGGEEGLLAGGQTPADPNHPDRRGDGGSGGPGSSCGSTGYVGGDAARGDGAGHADGGQGDAGGDGGSSCGSSCGGGGSCSS